MIARCGEILAKVLSAVIPPSTFLAINGMEELAKASAKPL
jgi:hypothetical protein